MHTLHGPGVSDIVEVFRHTALDVFWPACVILWTLIALIQLWESTHKHRKAVAALTKRLDRLEKKKLDQSED
jgi:hypothetical protein